MPEVLCKAVCWHSGTWCWWHHLTPALLLSSCHFARDQRVRLATGSVGCNCLCRIGSDRMVMTRPSSLSFVALVLGSFQIRRKLLLARCCAWPHHCQMVARQKHWTGKRPAAVPVCYMARKPAYRSWALQGFRARAQELHPHCTMRRCCVAVSL
jgi:hypothetical protein